MKQFKFDADSHLLKATAEAATLTLYMANTDTADQLQTALEHKGYTPLLTSIHSDETLYDAFRKDEVAHAATIAVTTPSPQDMRHLLQTLGDIKISVPYNVTGDEDKGIYAGGLTGGWDDVPCLYPDEIDAAIATLCPSPEPTKLNAPRQR